MMRLATTDRRSGEQRSVILGYLDDAPVADTCPASRDSRLSGRATIASRKAVRQWPPEVPLDGVPADNAAVVGAYRDWLTRTGIPKILFPGNAGIATKEAEVSWCRENLSNLIVVDVGDASHFIHETHPDTIGAEQSKWYAGFRSAPHQPVRPRMNPLLLALGLAAGACSGGDADSGETLDMAALHSAFDV